ncbi:von Willebrand factor type A domain-containing protein [Auriculariales sp. MPI-PUGE-AT-0066]|nr:von Willebrand factor type A domain-containing protein [Auriculariales sp. MPI-PUGE-AT-0066]
MSNCGIYPTVGVTVRRNDYPLVKASCEILVIDVNTLSKLSQTFVSTSAYAQDVNYVFPLPSDAAVCAFTAIIDGEHTIKGTVKERQEAQSAFNEARRAGKTAALVKQHTSQVFEVSLGNIKPRQSITVRLDLISVIAHAGINDCLRLRIPTSVARFYGAPPASLKGHSEGEIISFDFTATFQMTGNITSIRSDTHPVTCTIGALLVNPEERLNPTQAHVELHMIELLREDIVLEVRSNGLDSPRCFVQRWSPPGHGMTTDALSLTLVPRFKATPITSQDYVFLVDRSASMAGGRIRAVRDALHIMIRSLPSTGTTFNIFSFGTLCDSLWPTSQQYDQDRVTTAATHIDSMEADYGRTNIASAMQKVLEARRAAQAGVNVPTAVFVLTDGNAWDLQPVFRNVVRVVKHSHNATRVFVLGVGNQVSSEMCDGIARAGRGIATYVGEQENLGAKLVNLLKAARNFAVDDVSIDWGAPLDIEDDFVIVEPSHSGTTTPAGTIAPTSGSRAGLSLSDPSADLKEVIELDPTSQIPSLPPPPTVQQAPSRQDRLPPLYPGSRASIFALIKTDRAAPLPKTVHVRGTMSGSPVTLEVPVTAAPSELIPEDTHAPFFHSLAARALIQDIEDSAAASSLTSIATAQIARLGIEYSLASSQTSFIAVDNQSTDVVSPVAVSDKAETSPTVQRRGPARRRKRHLLCANPVSSESDGEESTVVVSDPRLIFNSPSIKNENSNSSQSPDHRL